MGSNATNTTYKMLNSFMYEHVLSQRTLPITHTRLRAHCGTMLTFPVTALCKNTDRKTSLNHAGTER